MKREVCKVVESTACFILENTMGELYRIEDSFKNEFKDGDEVLLIYTERTRVEDDIYEAEVYAVYPDSSLIAKPAKQIKKTEWVY